MKPLKQIYIENCKKAGFEEIDIPDILKITLDEWLTQKQLWAKCVKYMNNEELLAINRFMEELLEEIAPIGRIKNVASENRFI